MHYFVHDSAAYMEPAASRLKNELGYKNLVSLPCWAHILNKMGEVVLDGDTLVEMQEFMRLTRLLFARYALCAYGIKWYISDPLGGEPNGCNTKMLQRKDQNYF